MRERLLAGRHQAQMRRWAMALRINSEAPNFTAETTQGKINFNEWIGNGWAMPLPTR